MSKNISQLRQEQDELRKQRDNIEEIVEERTAELKKLVNLMAGREVRMAELKKAIRKLRAQLEEAGIKPVANDPLENGFGGLP